jgi:hypothetical protein
MNKEYGVMNSLNDSVKETIVNELNTLSNQELQWFIRDWDANSKIESLNYLQEMALHLAKITLRIREDNSIYSPARS